MPAKPRKRAPRPEAIDLLDDLGKTDELEQDEQGQLMPQPKTSYRTHPQGRDTYCSPQVIKVASQLHAAGLSLPVLCKAIGLSFETAKDWSTRGRADLAAGVDSPFARWWAALEEAKGASEANLIRMVCAGAATDWRAAAWLLERRYWQRWADPKFRLPKEAKDDLSGKSAAELQAILDGKEPPQLAASNDSEEDDTPDEPELDLADPEDNGKPPPIDIP